MQSDHSIRDQRCLKKKLPTSWLIQRRATSLFEFGLLSPPWMAYTLGNEFMSAITHLSEPRIHDSICSEEEFVEFASSLGRPVPLANGSVVKTLRVSPSREARSNSLSQRFGTGSFPFHTDTAFWPRPARLVLLRGVSGDLRRPTILTPFSSAINLAASRRVRQAAWLCDTGYRKNYTTMHFEYDGVYGLRYDPNCMAPANKAAQEIDELLRPHCFDIKGELIEWVPNRVAVIPNWTYLHARAPSRWEDLDRLIERIYIY